MREEVVYCPSCNHKLRVPEDLLGEPVQCPQCGTNFTAPVPAAYAPAPGVAVRPLGRPAPAPVANPAALVGPGLALLAVGILGVVLNGFQLSMVTGGREDFKQQIQDKIQEMQQNGQIKPGDEIPTPDEIVNVVQGLSTVFLCVSLLACAGAVSMLIKRFYPLAMIGSVAGMINLNGLCCLPGIPVGLWAIIAMNNPGNRALFRRDGPGGDSAGLS